MYAEIEIQDCPPSVSYHLYLSAASVHIACLKYRKNTLLHVTNCKTIITHFCTSADEIIQTNLIYNDTFTDGTSLAGPGRGVSLPPEVLPGQQLWERLFCLVLSIPAVLQGLWSVHL